MKPQNKFLLALLGWTMFLFTSMNAQNSEPIKYDELLNTPGIGTVLDVDEQGNLHVIPTASKETNLCIKLPETKRLLVEFAALELAQDKTELSVRINEEYGLINFRKEAEGLGVFLEQLGNTSGYEIGLFNEGEQVGKTELGKAGQVGTLFTNSILAFEVMEDGSFWIDLAEATKFSLPNSNSSIGVDEIMIKPFNVETPIVYTSVCLTTQNIKEYAILMEDSYTANPTISKMFPEQGKGGDEVLLIGKELNGIGTLQFGEIQMFPQLLGPDSLTVVLPNLTEGVYPILIDGKKSDFTFETVYDCLEVEHISHKVLKKRADEGKITADVQLNWAPLFLPEEKKPNYLIRYKLTGQENFQEVETEATTYQLSNLPISAKLTYQVGMICFQSKEAIYSKEKVINLGYSELLEVSTELAEVLENAPKEGSFETYLRSHEELRIEEINSFLIDFYRGATGGTGGTGGVSTQPDECYCRTTAVLPSQHITVPKVVASKNEDYASGNNRKRRTIQYNYKRWGAATQFYSYTRAKRMGTQGYVQDFSTAIAGSAVESRLTLMYLCIKNDNIADCACEKEVLIDAKYNSKIYLHTQLGTRNTEVEVEATDYAILMRYDGVATPDNVEVLAADHKSVYAYQNKTWNPKFFETITGIVGNVAQIIWGGGVSPTIISDLATDLGAIWTTPLNIWEGKGGAGTGYLTVPAFHTITIQPNVMTRLEWIENIKVRSYGKANGDKWYHGIIDIDSDYHLAVIVNPAGSITPAACCVEMTAGWIGGSYSGAPNSLQDVKYRIGDFLGHPYKWKNISVNSSNLRANINDYKGYAEAEEIICKNTCAEAPPTIQVGSSSNNICEGLNVRLMETGGDAIAWSWTGPNGFTSNQQNPVLWVVHMTDTGLYEVEITDNRGCTEIGSVFITVSECCIPAPPTCSLCEGVNIGPGPELVVNGDFEQGNTGFFSSYPSNCDCASDSYCVTDNARGKCQSGYWDPIQSPDCASNFMVVDANNGVIWSQIINVVNNQSYNFSIDIYPNISGQGSPILNVYLNNVLVGANITANPGNWFTYCGAWEADKNGAIMMEIRQAGNSGGNGDYGLDNISLRACIPNIQGRVRSNETTTLNSNNQLELQKPALKIAPNPFVQQATISFYIPVEGEVNLGVRDMTGRLVLPISSTNKDSGWHSVEIDRGSLPAGIYYLVLQTRQGTSSEKIVITTN